MLVLDTNHSRELEFRSALGLGLMRRIAAAAEDAVITAVTVEEQMRGWLAEVRRHTRPRHQVEAYGLLIRQVESHAKWKILPWDEDAVQIYEHLVGQRIRIGTQDLKIAAIALSHDAMLLTRNTVDFAKVPALKFANWLD